MHSYLPPASRAFDVASPVVVYRPIGRRPSQVYVDEAMTTATATTTQHRLSDLVYWRTTAEAGTQIQDRPSGLVLVAADGECHPIALSPPQPLQPATAFTHAQLAIDADREVIASLLAAGALTDVLPIRVKTPFRGQSDRSFAEDHPLVVDQLPARPLGAETEAPRRHGGRWRTNGKPARP